MTETNMHGSDASIIAGAFWKTIVHLLLVLLRFVTVMVPALWSSMSRATFGVVMNECWVAGVCNMRWVGRGDGGVVGVLWMVWGWLG